MAHRPRASFTAGLDWSFVVVGAIGLASAAAVLARDGWRVALEILLDDSILFLDILPKAFAGTLIGALVRILVPKAVIRQHLGARSGLTGLAIATFVGAIVPGGPFTIFPMAAALLVIGADRGVTVAFVTAWLLIGVNRAVIWEVPFLGADFVLTRALWSLPLPLIAGWAARRVGPPPTESRA